MCYTDLHLLSDYSNEMDVESVKTVLLSMIDKLSRDQLTQLVVWLDQRIAEYKVHGRFNTEEASQPRPRDRDCSDDAGSPQYFRRRYEESTAEHLRALAQKDDTILPLTTSHYAARVSSRASVVSPLHKQADRFHDRYTERSSDARPDLSSSRWSPCSAGGIRQEPPLSPTARALTAVPTDAEITYPRPQVLDLRLSSRRSMTDVETEFDALTHYREMQLMKQRILQMEENASGQALNGELLPKVRRCIQCDQVFEDWNSFHLHLPGCTRILKADLQGDKNFKHLRNFFPATDKENTEVERTEQPDTTGEPETQWQPNTSPPTSIPSGELRKEDVPIDQQMLEERVHYCGNCKNHGVLVKRVGHKMQCPYRSCKCERCSATLLYREKDRLGKASRLRTKGNGGPQAEEKTIISRFCGNCRNHGRLVKRAGHKSECPYINCHCARCRVTDWYRERDRWTKKVNQARKRAKMEGSKTVGEKSSLSPQPPASIKVEADVEMVEEPRLDSTSVLEEARLDSRSSLLRHNSMPDGTITHDQMSLADRLMPVGQSAVPRSLSSFQALEARLSDAQSSHLRMVSDRLSSDLGPVPDRPPFDTGLPESAAQPTSAAAVLSSQIPYVNSTLNNDVHESALPIETTTCTTSYRSSVSPVARTVTPADQNSQYMPSETAIKYQALIKINEQANHSIKLSEVS